MRVFHPVARAVGAVAAGALLLTACGGGSASSSSGGSGSTGGGKLDVYVLSQPNYPDQFAQWSKDITAKFKTATGGDLTIETYSSSQEETTKIQASVVSGNGPDVYQLGSTFTPVAFGTKGFLTLSDADWAKIGGKAKFVPEALGISGPDTTNLIGIPVATRPFGMVYNTDMFKAGGITKAPTTWDELVTDAQKLNDPSKGVHGLGLDFSDPFDTWKYIFSLTYQAGGRFISPDLKTAQLNSPQVVKATSQYFDLLTKYKLADPKSVGWKSADALAAFATGKVAILPMVSPTSVPTLQKSTVKGKYAYAPLPSVPFGATQRPAGAPAAQSIVSGDNVAIASYTKNKDLALAYVKLLTSTDMQVEMFKDFGNLPSTTEALTQVTKGEPTLAPFLAAEKGSTPTAFTGAWADIQNGITNTVVQSQPALAQGNYDLNNVQSLLEKANSTAQSSLTRANK